MNTGQNSNEDSLLLEALAQVHEICDEFDQAFRAGESPRIEDYLARMASDTPARSVLLLALLDIELELRRARGDRPGNEEYLARFPDHAATIANAFAELPTRTLRPDGGGDLGYALGDPVGTAAGGPSPASTEGGSDAPFDQSAETVGNRTAPGNRFRILDRIKEGGMGIIFTAADLELHRTVALKEMRPRYARDRLSRSRFVVEAEITGALEHPNIVPVYGLGAYPDGRPFYAMRLLADRTLRDAISEFHAGGALQRDQSRHSLEFRELLARFLDVCNAVDYAHHRGVVHRDLKPSNIMLGRYGETLVLDWGLAKLCDQVADVDARLREPRFQPYSATDEWRTWSGDTHGTIGYMPPEQARGHDAQIGPRSDVYALGAILYTMLTGSPSIKLSTGGESTQDDAQDVPKAIDAVIEGRFPRPREKNPRISPVLEAVCLRAMATAPDDRYSSVKALADEVKHWLADEPVSAYRESRSERLARWARRHRAAAQAAAASLVVISVISTVAAALVARAYGRETRAHSAERAARLQADENFARARSAVRELVELAGNSLAYVNGSETVRKQLAQKALASSREFLDSQPRDPNVRLDMARVLRVTANIGRMIGQFDEPLPLYEEATSLLRQLAVEAPSNRVIREESVSNIIDTGELYAMNGLPERSRFFAQTALDLLDSSDAPFQDSGSRNKWRAIASLNLASVQNDSGRYEDARISGTRAVELLSTPGSVDLADPINQLLLIMARDNLAFTERELGNQKGALQLCDLAVSGASALDAKYSSPDIKRALAAALDHRGELLARETNRQTQALAAFESAKRIVLPLANAYPSIPQFRREAAIACNGRGGVLLAQSREQTASDPAKATALLNRARADCETARGLLRDLLKARSIFDYESYLGRTLANLARIESARGNSGGAGTLFEQAAEAHRRAIAANPESQLDHKLLKDVDAERANLKR